MNILQKIIAAIGLTLLMSILVSAQEIKSNQTKTITVCPFLLTEAARTVSFRFNFSYWLEVNAIGKVSKITELLNSQRRNKTKFVRDELFVECINQWQLEPAGKYFVFFYVGTTSIGAKDGLPFNYMRVVDPNKKTLIIELTSSENDVIKIDESKKE